MREVRRVRKVRTPRTSRTSTCRIYVPYQVRSKNYPALPIDPAG